MDELIIGQKASYKDYGASLSKRKIAAPKKKAIKETVPFSNVTYDFSAINGEVYWEERQLEYVFEITAASPEKLEEMKSAFADCVMNVMSESIHDPFIPEHHFVATFDSITFEDEEGLEKTTATVVFSAYPYKIANNPTVVTHYSASSGTFKLYVENRSSHRITATLTAVFDEGYKDARRIHITANSASLYARSEEDYTFTIPVGVTEFDCVDSATGECKITVAFTEEVL